MQTILLLKAKIAHSAGFYFMNHRWHKVDAGKPVPAAAPFASHPRAAGQHAPVAHFTAEQWSQLKLPDSNVNAPTFNKQLETLQHLSDAGNVTAILGMKFGTNTYSKKLAQIANHLLGLHGSQHQVAPGQGAGEHAAVKVAPADPVTPSQPEKAPDPAPVPVSEPAPEAPAKDEKPATFFPMPAFAEGKTVSGVVDYYEGVANKIMQMAEAGDLDGLHAMKTEGMKPKANGKVSNTWAGKTANSKALIALHNKALSHTAAKHVAAVLPEPEKPADPVETPATPEPKPAPKTLGQLLTAEFNKQKAAEKVAQIPWDSLKLPDSNSNAGTFNKKLADIKAAAEAGDIAKLESMKHGVNTYGKKSAKIAATAIAALKEAAPAAPPQPAKKDYIGSIVLAGSASSAEMYANLHLDAHNHSDEAKEKVAAALAHNGHHDLAHKLTGAPLPEQPAAPAEPSPKEGDTKEGADGTLVFSNGRWHKQKAAAPESVSATHPIDAIPAPDLSGWKQAGQDKINAALAKLKEQVKAGDLSSLKGITKQMASGKIIINLPHPTYPDGYKMKVSGLSSAVKLKEHIDAIKAAAGKPVKAPKPKAAPAPVAPTIGAGGVQSMDSWQQTGPQGGSNPGGRFKDENGTEWYCKFPSSEDVAKSEVLAAKLYAAAGVAGQDAKLITKGGKLGIASRWVDVSKASSPDHLAKTDGAYSGFAVDAWLGNWDVVGLGYDNLQIGADGKAVRVDAGGSLEYRAQGGKKAFGANVTELDSLLDPSINPQAAAVFKGITKADIAASASKVAKLSDESIRILVNTYGPGDAAAKQALADTLIARKADIIAKYPTAKKQKVITFKAEKISEPPNFLNWGGSGKAGPSSKQFLNEANDKAVQAIYAAAKTGNVDAIKNLAADTFNKETGDVIGSSLVLEHPSQHVKGYAQQAINEINYQYNPPKRFRFDGGHPLHSLNSAYPSHKGALHGSAVNKVGKYILLGEPGKVSLDALALPKLTYQSGAVTKSTYAQAAQDSFAKMPLTQQQAVKSYTGNSYHAMNSSLWAGNPSGAAKAAAEALHTLGHDLAPGTVLSRKISLHGTDLDQILKTVGKVIQEPAIMSTSIRPSSWSGNVQLKLHVGPGVKGLWVGQGSHKNGGAISNHSGEDEILLPPNTRMLVLSVAKSSGTDADGFGVYGGHVIEAVILPTQDHS